MRSLGIFFILLLVFPANAQTAGTLRVAVPAIPSVLDPHRAVSPIDIAVAGELFMGLVTRGADGAIVPGIASSWDISADGLIYTFSLRSDAKWSDGRRVSVGDIVAGFERALDPETKAPLAGDLFMIEAAEDVHKGRRPLRDLGVSSSFFGKLRISLVRPSAHFLDVLTRPIAAPIPRHVMNDEVDSGGIPGVAVTNGAFTTARSGTAFSLVRNPHFFGVPPTEIERIDFLVAESAAAAGKLVEDGLANLTLGVSFEIKGGPEPVVSRADGGRSLYSIVVNVRKPVLGVRGVRHALAMSIDRESLVKDISVPGATAAYKVIPSDILNESVSPPAPYARLPAEMRGAIAEVLLAESQVSPNAPHSLKLVYPQGEIHEAIARHVAAAWAPLGIEMLAAPLPTAEYDRALFAGDFDVALSYGQGEGESPMAYMESLTRIAGPMNVTGYAEPDFDRRLEAADTTLDSADRLASFAEAENVLIQDQVILPLFFFTPRHTVAEAVQGWEANVYGSHPLRHLSLR